MFRWGRRGGVRKVAERANVPMRAPRDVRFRKRRRFRYGGIRGSGACQRSDAGAEGRPFSEASPLPLRGISTGRNGPRFRFGHRGTCDFGSVAASATEDFEGAERANVPMRASRDVRFGSVAASATGSFEGAERAKVPCCWNASLHRHPLHRVDDDKAVAAFVAESHRRAGAGGKFENAELVEEFV